MVNVVGVLEATWTGLIAPRNGGSVVVSAATFTWKVLVVVTLVAVSSAVTVRLAVPVVPAGTESRSTPSSESVKIEAPVMFTVLEGAPSVPTAPRFTSCSRMPLSCVRKPKIV